MGRLVWYWQRRDHLRNGVDKHFGFSFRRSSQVVYNLTARSNINIITTCSVSSTQLTILELLHYL